MTISDHLLPPLTVSSTRARNLYMTYSLICQLCWVPREEYMAHSEVLNTYFKGNTKKPQIREEKNAETRQATTVQDWQQENKGKKIKTEKHYGGKTSRPRARVTEESSKDRVLPRHQESHQQQSSPAQHPVWEDREHHTLGENGHFKRVEYIKP